MGTARFAHVVTCWVYLGALVLQFAVAGDEFGGLYLHLVVPLVLVLTAWLGKLGWQQVLLSFGLFVPLTAQIMVVGIGAEMDSTTVQGLYPSLALLSAGYVVFLVLERALDAAPTSTQHTVRG